MSKIKIGAVFPHQEIGSDPVVIRDWAQAAEELGYSHLLAYDHVIGAVHENRQPKLWGPYTEQDDFHEPFVLFGYLAACTSRVELATGILISPQRQTVLIAKQAAEIDLLSGERLRLGIGTGWNYVEYDALGYPFEKRGAMQAEQVDVMRALWEKSVIDYEGEFHRIERAGLKPLPKRQIPIWFGGFNPVAFRRAATIGDGFIFGSGQTQNLQGYQQLQEALKASNRTQPFGIEALLNYQSGQDAWREEVQAWIDVGANYVAMRAQALRGQGDGLASPQDHIDALQTYWDEVGDLGQ